MDDWFTLKHEVEENLFKVDSENITTFDPHLDDSLIQNYTINCFFKEKDLTFVNILIDTLRSVDPNQLFYTPSQLHVTLLGQIDLNSDKNQIIKTVQDFLDQNKIMFHLFGVGGGKKAAFVTAYPIGFSIDKFRLKLRKVGGGKVFDDPYEKLAWINFMRYLVKPRGEFFDVLRGKTNTDFGIVKPSTIQLLKNSSRLLNGSETVHNFAI